MSTTETLRIELIRTDGDTHVRAKLDAATVSQYAEAMAEGASFPPIVAFNDGQTYWLADGFHRLAATKQLGHQTIRTIVRTGSRDDAIWYALGANRSNGRAAFAAEPRRVQRQAAGADLSDCSPPLSGPDDYEDVGEDEHSLVQEDSGPPASAQLEPCRKPLTSWQECTLIWLLQQTEFQMAHATDFGKDSLAVWGVRWPGEPGLTRAQSACRSRMLRDLERRGLVLRQNQTNGYLGRAREDSSEPHTRTTHVLLTEAGVALARALQSAPMSPPTEALTQGAGDDVSASRGDERAETEQPECSAPVTQASALTEEKSDLLAHQTGESLPADGAAVDRPEQCANTSQNSNVSAPAGNHVTGSEKACE